MTKTFLTTLMRHSMLLAMVLSMGWFAKPSQAILLCATLVPPGGSNFPGDCTGSATGTEVAKLSEKFTVLNALGKTVATGTFDTAVFRETATGTLDFYYQVFNDASSKNALHRETNTDFSGFLTFTAFRTDCGTLPCGTVGFTNGNIAPTTSDSSGDTIGFAFPIGAGTEIAPGTSSNVLVISTDATMFTAGSSNIIDGGVASVLAFAPAVPEPMSLVLLGSGLLCLGVLRRKKGTV